MELKQIKEVKGMQLKLDVLTAQRKKVNKEIKRLNTLIPKLIRNLELEDANAVA